MKSGSLPESGSVFASLGTLRIADSLKLLQERALPVVEALPFERRLVSFYGHPSIPSLGEARGYIAREDAFPSIAQILDDLG